MDFYGTSIALLIQSFDHSLFIRLMVAIRRRFLSSSLFTRLISYRSVVRYCDSSTAREVSITPYNLEWLQIPVAHNQDDGIVFGVADGVI